MDASETQRAIRTVFRLESAKLIAGLARIVRDVGLAEELAQDALVAALEQWPGSGVPDNPGAWLMAAARNRAINVLRREKMKGRKHEELVFESDAAARQEDAVKEIEDALDGEMGDDLLRLMFTACHPLLSTEARVALTLRLLGGLTTEEIARAFLVPEPTIAQRIVRAKRTLAEKRVPFEIPRGSDLAARLSSVLEVIYLVFNEGYSATAGDRLMRQELCEDALRLGRILAELEPDQPEVHGLVALMEINASRSAARTDAAGEPVLLLDQDRSRWDRLLDPSWPRGSRACRRTRGRRGPLRAAGQDHRMPCARAHARRNGLDAHRCRSTPSSLEVTQSPVVALNRAVAVVDGRRAGRRPAAHGCSRGGACAPGLPPLAERQGRRAREARPPGRGARGVRARRVALEKRAAAPATPRPCRGLRASTLNCAMA